MVDIISLIWRWSKTPRESVNRTVFTETYIELHHATVKGESGMLGRDPERIILKLQHSEWSMSF